jgi:hypothetical protein
MPKTIKMLKDFAVAKDGFTVERWKEGEVHEDVPDALADDLLHDTTLAASLVTGNKAADEKAEAAVLMAQEKQAEELAAQKALADAAAMAALQAARTAPAG